MASLNINSLNKHIDELKVLMMHKPIDVFAINESKLDQDDADDLIALTGYIVERRDLRKIGIRNGKPRYIECRNFKNFSESKFIKDLKSAHWPIINEFDDVNDACDTWTSVFSEVIEKHAPVRSFRVRNKPSPWLNSELKYLMINRDKLKKKAISSNNSESLSAYKQQRNFVNNKIKKAKKAYFQDELNRNVNNVKETWKILNNALGKKSDNIEINTLSSDSGEILTESFDIANSLNKHFVGIGPKLASNVPLLGNVATAKDYMTQVESSFEFQKIDSKDVFKLINKLNLRKASGCDKISNRLLKISGPYIYEALTNLFNLSLTTNKFPTRWKIAKVFPLHKTEERDNANNYRPISVLSSIARLFERLVYNQVYAYLSKHRLINTRQSGFRSLHSTMTALLDMTNQWCFNIDKGMLNGVIFLDLKKAFDTIDHAILQMKLACYGLKECSLEWVESYLTNR
ncbi:Hypothetical predicted protein, partial [Paramuricea clavata]